ncbi:MAG: class I SAM-dependent methyltransferase [Verrucomicrobia bacterium]|nr:class I SAM-dependent methyltransferase [Verrucomicrobiota bacterium]
MADRGSEVNIVRVDRERWKDAQEWEAGYWKGADRWMARYGKSVLWRILASVGLKPRYRGDDWNEWWAKQFDHYEFLPMDIASAIELGCGPFTNIRLIHAKRRIGRLVLSDPLLPTYFDFQNTFVRDMYKRHACEFDTSPIEECPFDSKSFDLVVMINVLDHVFDADAGLANARRIVKPGGHLIIGQDLTDEEDYAHERVRDNVGHPIKLGHQWLDDRLLDGFEPIIHQVLDRENGRSPKIHYGTYLFAGRKSVA